MLSLQLETVLQVQSGSTNYLYLIQNVPEIDTAAQTLGLVSNVYAWGTSTETPGTTTCAQDAQTITYQMDNMSGQDGSVQSETGSAQQCSPYFYASFEPGFSFQLPISIVVGSKITGNHVVLFYDIPGSPPVVWETLTFSIPGSLSFIASTSAGGGGVGSAAFYIGGPGGGESATFSSIAGELGLYYVTGTQVVPFSDIENASSSTTTVPEGTSNVSVGIGSDGFLTLSEGPPTTLADTQFNPPVPSALDSET